MLILVLFSKAYIPTRKMKQNQCLKEMKIVKIHETGKETVGSLFFVWVGNTSLRNWHLIWRFSVDTMQPQECRERADIWRLSLPPCNWHVFHYLVLLQMWASNQEFNHCILFFAVLRIKPRVSELPQPHHIFNYLLLLLQRELYSVLLRYPQTSPLRCLLLKYLL
jgi:hypothetical protein